MDNKICLDSPLSSIDWAEEDGENVQLYTVARCVTTRGFKQLPSVNDVSFMLDRPSGDMAGWSTDDLANYAVMYQGESLSSKTPAGPPPADRDMSGNR